MYISGQPEVQSVLEEDEGTLLYCGRRFCVHIRGQPEVQPVLLKMRDCFCTAAGDSLCTYIVNPMRIGMPSLWSSQTSPSALLQTMLLG